MAPLGKFNRFYRAKREKVRVTENFSDPDLPLEVQQALRDMEIGVLFFEDPIPERLHIPIGAALAYLTEIREDLVRADKTTVAAMLNKLVTGELDMLMIPPDQFTRIGNFSVP